VNPKIVPVAMTVIAKTANKPRPVNHFGRGRRTWSENPRSESVMLPSILRHRVTLVAASRWPIYRW